MSSRYSANPSANTTPASGSRVGTPEARASGVLNALRDDTLRSSLMNHENLQAAAHQEMLGNGFHPDFSPQIETQLAAIRAAVPVAPGPAVKDLRNLLWSSIDNDSSRDLDQIEYAERQPDGSTRVLVGIADVDGSVPKGSPIDLHAADECVSVYTGVETFPML